MKIEIKADNDVVLGGPDHIPYLKLELREDSYAVLHASHRPSSRCAHPLDEQSERTCAWSASSILDRMRSRISPRLKRSRTAYTRCLPA